MFVCMFLNDNSKRNRSRNRKLEYIVVYENSSDEFDIVNSISALDHVKKLRFSSPAHLTSVNTLF